MAAAWQRSARGERRSHEPGFPNLREEGDKQMSVEAISWALNLAPVPRDGGSKRNPACKAVLIGLANHAGPDGTGAFPSVRTLVRYTALSERTVVTALDRLEAEGVIRPCDPAIVAAKIKRADRRPQGWDLAMHLIRGDLDDEDLAALEPQFPGLAARVREAAAARSGQPDDGVQPLHPAPVAAVDNAAHGAQPLHPVSGTGCSQRGYGVQPFPGRGAAIAPEPSLEPSREPSAAPARARETARPVENPERAAAKGVGEFFTALGPTWPLTARQQARLAPAVAAALAAGWEPRTLAGFAGGNTSGVRSPYAVLAARLSAAELPAPPLAALRRPPWCGESRCDPVTRFLLDERGYPGTIGGRAVPCPRCGAPAARQRAPARTDVSA
jgi:Helix-turn-helix domain